MNKQVYLKKLIREEILKTKEILLSEQEGAIGIVDQEVKPGEEEEDKEWDGPEEEAAKWLEKIGATKVSLGPNPYGYIVVCNIKKMDGSTAKEKLRFFEDGDVYSYNLAATIGWELDGDVMKIKNISATALNPLGNESKELGYIDTSKPITFVVTAEAEEEEYSDSDKWQDQVQTVLDWLGFLPGVGDIIDLINGSWYFYRGKWFDGALSMIAIIPFVGSALKASVKSAAKATGIAKATKYLRKSFTNGGDKYAKNLWADMLASGTLDIKKISAYEEGFETLANLGLKTKNMMRSAPNFLGNAPRTVEAMADQAILFAKNHGKAIDDVMDAVKKAEKAKDAAMRGLKTAESGIASTKLGKLGNKLTLNIFPTLKKAGKWPTKQLDQMADLTARRFVKRLNDPSKIGVLAVTSGKTGLKSSLALKSRKIIEKLPGGQLDLSMVRDLENAGLGSLLKKKNGKVVDIKFDKLESATDAANLFKVLDKSKSFNPLKDKVIKDSIDGMHPAWRSFKDAEFNKLWSSMSLNSGLKSSIYKNFDIISNELQDVGQDLGFGPDASEGVVYPIAKEMFNYTLGDTQPVQMAKRLAAGYSSPEFQSQLRNIANQSVETMTAGYLRGSDISPLDSYEIAGGAATYDPEEQG